MQAFVSLCLDYLGLTEHGNSDNGYGVMDIVHALAEIIGLLSGVVGLWAFAYPRLGRFLKKPSLLVALSV